MPQKPDISRACIRIPPCPTSGFQTDLVRELQNFVAELPVGVAQLQIGRVPDHPEWPEPYFEIIPAKPHAAHFAGFAVSNDLTITIGEAEREFIGFARGGNIVRGASWQEELRWIWRVILAGGFAQRHYLDSTGRVIGWLAHFRVNGKEVVFRNGRRAEKLFGQVRVRTVTYEPYV